MFSIVLQGTVSATVSIEWIETDSASFWIQMPVVEDVSACDLRASQLELQRVGETDVMNTGC